MIMPFSNREIDNRKNNHDKNQYNSDNCHWLICNHYYCHCFDRVSIYWWLKCYHNHFIYLLVVWRFENRNENKIQFEWVTKRIFLLSLMLFGFDVSSDKHNNQSAKSNYYLKLKTIQNYVMKLGLQDCYVFQYYRFKNMFTIFCDNWNLYFSSRTNSY